MNPVVCGNCQTENPAGADVCENCGAPLTRSAESGLVEREVAQQHASLTSAPGEEQQGTANTYIPNTDTPVKDGLPTD